MLEKTNNKLLEKTNNSEPLNRFNKKCQVNINFERGVLLPGAINQAPETRGKIDIKIYPTYPQVSKLRGVSL